ncbi:AAA family ATPase [Archangium violaceum]|uniref:AAA family ATPase n=1 Tax=Archangium violaceum TaxID=83451 RepID=UPI0036DD7450
MVKLRWLQVNRFRTVKPGTRLTFNPGHNVLLGQNGTGKTTLLNLVAAAITVDFTSLGDVEFDLSFELASDKATATISVRNEPRPPPFPSAWKGIISPEALRQHSLTPEGGLGALMLSTTVSISRQEPALHLEIDIKGNRGVVRRTDEADSSAPVTLDFANSGTWPLWVLIINAYMQYTSTAIEPARGANEILALFVSGSSGRFDESLEYFNDLGQLQLKLMRTPEGQVSAAGNLGPSESMNERLRHLARQRWVDDRYVLTDADLPFLKHTAQLLDFESAEAIVELKDSGKEGNTEVMHLGNLRFYFSHRGGWKISEKLLSYGQKRILAFMHYLASAPSAVIADELVNGLHHRWIRACFEALGPRQAFLTSQNPLLLDYLSFQSPEEVRSAFVLCRWEKGPEQMVWENMSQEAAVDFFDSYKVGFQQVGELLQSKGLW